MKVSNISFSSYLAQPLKANCKTLQSTVGAFRNDVSAIDDEDKQAITEVMQFLPTVYNKLKALNTQIVAERADIATAEPDLDLSTIAEKLLEKLMSKSSITVRQREFGTATDIAHKTSDYSPGEEKVMITFSNSTGADTDVLLGKNGSIEIVGHHIRKPENEELAQLEERVKDFFRRASDEKFTGNKIKP